MWLEVNAVGCQRRQRTIAVILLVDFGPAPVYLLLEDEHPRPVEELLVIAMNRDRAEIGKRRRSRYDEFRKLTALRKRMEDACVDQDGIHLALLQSKIGFCIAGIAGVGRPGALPAFGEFLLEELLGRGA